MNLSGMEGVAQMDGPHWAPDSYYTYMDGNFILFLRTLYQSEGCSALLLAQKAKSRMFHQDLAPFQQFYLAYVWLWLPKLNRISTSHDSVGRFLSASGFSQHLSYDMSTLAYEINTTSVSHSTWNGGSIWSHDT